MVRKRDHKLGLFFTAKEFNYWLAGLPNGCAWAVLVVVVLLILKLIIFP